MLQKLLCSVFLAGFILQSPAYGVEPGKLPFFNKEVGFTIELPANKPLRALLERELAKQRKNNHQLQHYSKPDKIAFYEARLLTEKLKSEGYYGSQVNSRTNGNQIVYSVYPGPVYLIQQLTVDIPDHIVFPLPDMSALNTGSPLRAESVLTGKKALSQAVNSSACLYEVDAQYKVKVFHTTHTAEIIYTITDSPTVALGEINFIGQKTIDADYLLRLSGLKSGDCFNRKQLDVAQLRLTQSNLLARVNILTSQPVDGRVDISIHVTERFQRTLSAGIGYQSDEGLGLSAGWQHRNWLGQGQKLAADAHIAEQKQSLSSSLTFPHYQRNNQSLAIYTDLERENTDAYESKLATAGIEISRPLKPYLLGFMGAEIEFSEITENRQTEDYALVSVPLGLEYDKRNDPLDPRHGWVAALKVRPYWNAYQQSTRFFKTTLAGSAYYTIDNWRWQPTIAARAVLGTISGISRDEVPANIRYYVGGGGSVRGYPYQTLGAITDGEPDGGLSFSEVSFETRLHWGNDWGGVIFLDGGFAYEDTTPKINERMLWGAGFGLRYYTSFAPIRFDIALPLDRRSAVDDSFQIYISIGQAF